MGKHPPAPTVNSYVVYYDSDGDVSSVNVSVDFWDQDHTVTKKIPFSVRDGVASVRSIELGGRLNLYTHLTPIMAAAEFLRREDETGVSDVRRVSEIVKEAHAEAMEAFDGE